MRLLLDTNVVLWRFSGERDLGPTAAAAVAEAEEALVSVVAYIEIGIRARLGKLAPPSRLAAEVAASELRLLPVDPADGLALGSLPLLHRDPFDRLLVTQARRRGLTILTADRKLAAYDVRVVDALT